MASTQRPPEHVRRRLATERAAGASFDPAWARALAAIPPGTRERAEWVAALKWSRAEFESAYHGAEAGRGALREDVLLAA